MSIVSRILPNERARHVVIAGAVAFVLVFLDFLAPLDRMIWLIESRLGTHEVSGEFVFVEADKNIADPTYPERRLELADSLIALNESAVDRILIDMVFDEASTLEADERLASAIAALGDKAILTKRLQRGLGEPEETIDEIAGATAVAVDQTWVDFTNLVWDTRFAVEIDGQEFPTVPTVLANRDTVHQDWFVIDYNYDPSSIDTIPISRIRQSDTRLFDRLADKTIIIGHSEKVPLNAIDIPGYREVPTSIVRILAAETLLRGGNQAISSYMVTLACALLLLIATFPNFARAHRRAIYLGTVASLAAYLIYCSQTGAPPQLAHALGFLATYCLLRFLSNRKAKQLIFDAGLGLPTFVALERDLNKIANVQRTSVVVAKLHRFDEITSALSDEAIFEYVQQIASRFRIAEQDLQVYTKGGKYLAWLTETSDRDMLESHLRGLRAVFAHPLVVKEIPVDVGITFAVDMTAEDNAARKIASANSTLEKTTEAHEPVLFAELASEGDRWWSISLQAKIDEALEQGHIYVVFQPKLNVRLGTVVGAEALVRWKDPERGNIAPNYFIEQCENAGRMDHLTRHVLRESLLAAQDFARTNAQFTVSVNISATMLRDYRVAEMVEEIVEKTGFNPRNLVLEITETSRIADYDSAYDVMTRQRLHGIKLSIDDFGVGSASMETLLRLPFDELKIDRAFIARMHNDQKARAISQMMIAFGKQTRITVVAEGVEDEEIMKLLRDLGCEIVQGYHISKPLEKEKFSQFQSDNQREFSRQKLHG